MPCSVRSAAPGPGLGHAQTAGAGQGEGIGRRQGGAELGQATGQIGGVEAVRRRRA